MEAELKKVAKLKSDIKIGQDQPMIEELQRKKEQLGHINNEIKANKISYFEENRKKNQFESEVEVFGQQKEVSYGKMRKRLPLLEFNLLNELRKRKINGVYGFLIEFLDININVCYAYEMAGLSKLCTLLVEDEAVCEKVIEINRLIKGKGINVLPLSIV
jgi:chromosome segregation ATPase